MSFDNTRNRLLRPGAGQDMVQRLGQKRWQITLAVLVTPSEKKVFPGRCLDLCCDAATAVTPGVPGQQCDVLELEASPG